MTIQFSRRNLLQTTAAVVASTTLTSRRSEAAKAPVATTKPQQAKTGPQLTPCLLSPHSCGAIRVPNRIAPPCLIIELCLSCWSG